jgi:putative ABC transport system permease protein
MLERFFSEPLPLSLAQAAAAMAFAIAIMLLARNQNVHMEKEILVALGRGLLQILAIGSILLLLLEGPYWTSVPVLSLMIVVAASIASRRAGAIPAALRVSLAAIGSGAGLVVGSMTALGVIDPAPSSLIPVGSIVIAGAMNSAALALERFRSEVLAHTGQIEAALALGAEPKQTVTRYVQAAVEASLIPSINSLRSLGIVWIPGLMAGMILTGSDPVYAAIYQFVVIAMIFASGGLTSLLCTRMIRGRAFSPAQQLVLRPGDPGLAGHRHFGGA